jgi:hypothetical protein
MMFFPGDKTNHGTIVGTSILLGGDKVYIVRTPDMILEVYYPGDLTFDD